MTPALDGGADRLGDLVNSHALSSYRENRLEQLVTTELVQAAWIAGLPAIELARAFVDFSGYDLGNLRQGHPSHSAQGDQGPCPPASRLGGKAGWLLRTDAASRACARRAWEQPDRAALPLLGARIARANRHPGPLRDRPSNAQQPKRRWSVCPARAPQSRRRASQRLWSDIYRRGAAAAAIWPRKTRVMSDTSDLESAGVLCVRMARDRGGPGPRG